MTVAKLATIYGLTRQTILDDIHAHTYPYTRHIFRDDGAVAIRVQDFVQFYPRSVWQRIRKRKPDQLKTNTEREAYIVAYGHKLTTLELAEALGIPTKKVRALYNRAFDAGRVYPVITSEEEVKT